MKKTILPLTLLAAAIAPAFAGSAPKYDGNWSVSVVTEKGHCDAYKWTIVVAGNQLKKVNDAPLSASGGIDASGQARFLFTSIADKVTANGQMDLASGSGRWDAPSRECSGHWQAARL